MALSPSLLDLPLDLCLDRRARVEAVLVRPSSFELSLKR